MEIISNLHNLQEITVKILERMPIIYNLKTDIRYQQGIEQGIERGFEKGKDNQATITTIIMLIKTNFSAKQIAAISGVDLKFIEKWQQAMEKAEVKTVWNAFGVSENNKKQEQLRARAMVILLDKKKVLPVEVLTKVTNLTEKEVQKIRSEQKKKK